MKHYVVSTGPVVVHIHYHCISVLFHFCDVVLRWRNFWVTAYIMHYKPCVCVLGGGGGGGGGWGARRGCMGGGAGESIGERKRIVVSIGFLCRSVFNAQATAYTHTHTHTHACACTPPPPPPPPPDTHTHTHMKLCPHRNEYLQITMNSDKSLLSQLYNSSTAVPYCGRLSTSAKITEL